MAMLTELTFYITRLYKKTYDDNGMIMLREERTMQ